LRGEAGSMDAAEIKKLLHDRFGGIHIECKIVMVDEIAKTATGKKIRHALSMKSD
jgi:acyl-coenzyme A synthetase/AMP-(fatty) acid ligase